MASGTGTTISPSGEPGVPTQASAPIPTQLPDNPATIAQTTGSETLQQVLYGNYIYRNTFTVDPTMKPGHVFGYIAIHPMNVNDYITHVARMFATWTGNFLTRARFLANFANGGSFRIGFLPPIFTEHEIQNLPISTLTAYPNMDLDPKNTEFVHFKCSDERNIAFHWMRELDSLTQQDFGGWVIFYVVGPLVQSLQTTGSVSLIVECCGNFQFDQIRPISSIGPNPPDSGPLPASVTSNLQFQLGCDDWLVNDRHFAVQVNPSSQVSMPCGWWFANAVGGGLPSARASGSKASPNMLALRTSIENGTLDVVPRAPAITDIPGSSGTSTLIRFNSNSICPPNATSDYYQLTFNLAQALDSGLGEWSNDKTITENNPTRPFYFSASSPNFHDHSDVEGYIGPGSSKAHIQNAVEFSGISFTNDDSSLKTILPNESIVSFSNLSFRTTNLQTRQMAIALKSMIFNPDISYLYELHSADTSGPLLIMRLCPSGMWTTIGSASTLIINKPGAEFFLRFVQTLPVTTPIPVSARLIRRLERLEKAAERKNSSLFWDRI